MRAGLPVFLYLSCILLTSPLPSSAQISPESGSAGQLAAATAALGHLADLDAGFLIPDTYKKVRQAYDRYNRAVREGKSARDTQRAYATFEAAVVQARERLARVNEILMVPLQKRSAAQRTNAAAMVPKAFETAETLLERAISRLEDDKISDAFAYGQEAATAYDEARSAVVEKSLVGSAQAGLSEAEERNWDRFAPASFAAARRLMNDVTGALDRGELPSALRNKAFAANYAANYAVQMAARIDSLRGDPANWERMLQSKEYLARQAADLAGIAVDFLVDDPEQVLSASLARLAARQDSLVLRSRRAEERVAVLRTAVDSLNQALEEQQIRLTSMVENFQRDLQQRKEALDRERRELRDELNQKTRLDAAAEVRARFPDAEVSVMREEDRLVLRLVGLSFQTGKTDIPRSARGLLEKLGAFLALYPEAGIAIEGHTDATGREEKNLALSRSRADAVMEFLEEEAGIGAERMAASGHGSAQPIASNNTRTGRNQNRRIDLVLTFAGTR